jgi:hypothetical protein
MSEERKEKERELRELVLARIDVMPPNLKLSIGNFGTFTKQELMEHVRNGDEAGKQIVQMQLNFIKALTSGRLIETLNQNG